MGWTISLSMLFGFGTTGAGSSLRRIFPSDAELPHLHELSGQGSLLWLPSSSISRPFVATREQEHMGPDRVLGSGSSLWLEFTASSGAVGRPRLPRAQGRGYLV